MDVIFIIIGCIGLFFFLKTHSNQKKFSKVATISIASGNFALLIAAIATSFIGKTVAVNVATVFIASVFGIPGVIVVVLKIFFV